MAIFYVRSTDGNDADSGATWALAKATLAGAASASAAGDTIYVSQAHAETQASAMTITFPGGATTWNRVLCVSDSAEPPTTMATTGSISTTGANAITITGSVYVFGLTINTGTSAGTASLNLGNANGSNSQWWSHCAFVLNGGSSSRIVVAGRIMEWRNTTWKFGHASQFVSWGGSTNLFVYGGGIASGSAGVNAMHVTSTLINANYSAVNLSNLASTGNLINTSSGSGLYRFINCQLPSGWSGSLQSAPTSVFGVRVEMNNSDGADTNYRSAVSDSSGTLVTTTSVYNDAGATDGTTRVSWKVTSTTLAEFMVPFRTTEIVRWNETTGSAITATVEIVHDGASAATDGEVWLEVMSLGTSGVPLGTWISDAKADTLASATAQATSSATWTGDTGTGPNGSSTWHTLKLACTFTPQEKGFLHARVVVAKASWTVYVDPLVTVT